MLSASSLFATLVGRARGPGQEGAGQQLKEVAGLSDSINSAEIRSRVQAAGGLRCLFQVHSPPAGPAGPGRKALDSSSRKFQV